MKQVLQDRRGLTVVRDVPRPLCGPQDVLVRTLYSVISSGTERTRVALSQKSLLGKARERPDLVREVIDRAVREGLSSTRETVHRKLAEETPVGYSSAGVVLETGSAVAGLAPGDLVACAGAGRANHAEIVSVPHTLCARLPDVVAPLEAAFATIAAIPLHAIRLAEVALGERVAVIGCGLVGQIACRLLSASGAEVFALDVDPLRVEQARAGGADHALDANGTAADAITQLTGGAGADRALVTAAAATAAPLELAARILRDRGSLVLVGDVPVELPRSLLYDKELVFRVSRSYGPGRYDRDYEERGHDYPMGYVRWSEQRNLACVLDLLARRRLALADLVDEIIPIEDAARAYARLTDTSESPLRGALVLAYGDPETDAPAPAALRLARTSAPGTMRLGLIGAGNFAARTIVPGFVAAGVSLELVGGGAGPSAEAAVRTLGFTRAAVTEQDVLVDRAVDAVAICTRHGSHAALARDALSAGKHVFCEKPLALDRVELGDVLHVAERAAGVLAVGFNRRYAPMLRELRDHMHSQPGPLIAVYRVSAGTIPSDHWVHDLEQGGGRALGELCHFVDALTFVVGSPVSEVHATGHGAPGQPLAARDNLVVTLSFADGSVGTVLYAALGASRVAKERLEVFAGTRTGILDDYRALELYDGRKRQRRRRRAQDKGHVAEIAAFVQAAAAGQPPVPLTEVENVSAASIAIIESLQRGEPVRP